MMKLTLLRVVKNRQVKLSHVMLCFVMLCYVVLCYVMFFQLKLPVGQTPCSETSDALQMGICRLSPWLEF
jgi:hypothetical protein